MQKDLINKIHDFWFGEAFLSSPLANASCWWAKDPEYDNKISELFEPHVESAIKGEYESWAYESRSLMALILLLDQFPRNIYRDDPRAYSGDKAAREYAKAGLAEGMDRELHAIKRTFFYMPMMHSEHIQDQETSLRLFKDLADTAADEKVRAQLESSYDFAIRHYEIIAKFGRYPHRNAVLGRESTAKETEFLKGPGSSF